MAIAPSGIWKLEQHLQTVCPMAGGRCVGSGFHQLCCRPGSGASPDRCNNYTSTPLCGWSLKKNGGQETQALGRSRGGFSCKIHAAVDALGNPIRLTLTSGATHDVTQGEALTQDLKPGTVIADKGYDSDPLVVKLTSQGVEAVIPPRSNRKTPREYDRHLYKERHLVECFFNKIKHFRRIFSRFDKLAKRYLAFLHFVSALRWLR